VQDKPKLETALECKPSVGGSVAAHPGESPCFAGMAERVFSFSFGR
jgi:hypothetical protein